MTNGQLKELMGNSATDDEAAAMVEVLHAHDYTTDDVGYMSDDLFFEFIPLAVKLAEEKRAA